jgi:hypothetical protein
MKKVVLVRKFSDASNTVTIWSEPYEYVINEMSKRMLSDPQHSSKYEITEVEIINQSQLTLEVHRDYMP